jgi:hypothetical protein
VSFTGSDNLSSQASEAQAAHWTNYTFNGVAADIFVDPTNATLGSRDYTLKAGSVAIDNGTTGICTSADTSANRCASQLTLTSYLGSSVDQGAYETDAPVTAQVILQLPVDSDFVDLSTLSNDGTGTSVDFDAVNFTEGTGSALFNSATDKLVVPLTGAAINKGLTLFVQPKYAVLGDTQYIYGASSDITSFADRIQLWVNSSGFLVVGMGDNHNALITNFAVAAANWYSFTLVIHPPSTVGGSSGSFDLYSGNILLGQGVYKGLSTIPATITFGNNGVTQVDGWGVAGDGQIDNIWGWNSALTAAEVAAHYALYSLEPDPNTDPLDFVNLTIGNISASVVSGEISSGADPAICSPLTNVQVTCNGVAKTETTCQVSLDSSPVLTITLSAACQAGDVVELSVTGYDDPWTVDNNIVGPTVPLVMNFCQTSITGLQVTCELNGVPDSSVCQDLSKYRIRDNCVLQTISACSLSTTGRGQLQLTRALPPTSGSVAVDLLYLPSDQLISITNLYDTESLPPEEPSPTGVNQHGWHYRPVGKNDNVYFIGASNTTGSVAAGGSIGARIAVANESGAQVSGIGYTLYCAKRAAGADTFGDMTRVQGGMTTDPYNTIGLRYDPATPDKLADNASLAKRAIALGSLDDSGIRRYRRQASPTTAYVLADDAQMEEEHAIQVMPGVEVGTMYVCRLYDSLGVALSNYDGLTNCVQGAGSYAQDEVPCGAPFIVRNPIFWRY